MSDVTPEDTPTEEFCKKISTLLVDHMESIQTDRDAVMTLMAVLTHEIGALHGFASTKATCCREHALGFVAQTAPALVQAINKSAVGMINSLYSTATEAAATKH